MLSDTYFVIGHFHMVMGVSPILAIFGAIYHWCLADDRPFSE
jgi:cytochrome c oxidase subunit 1